MKLFDRLRAFFQWPVNLMVGLIILTIIAWVRFHNRYFDPNSLDMELAKAVLEVGIISVAGTLLKFVVSETDRRRADRRAKEDLLAATLNRVTSSYNNSKRARREMRALARDCSKKPAVINVARYDKYMVGINEAQLELETIKSDVETNERSFRSAAELKPGLKKMESYLNEIVSEYEDIRSLKPTEVEIPLEDLSWLSDFLGEVEGSKFKSEFSSQHSKVRTVIRDDLRELTSVSTA